MGMGRESRRNWKRSLWLSDLDLKYDGSSDPRTENSNGLWKRAKVGSEGVGAREGVLPSAHNALKRGRCPQAQKADRRGRRRNWENHREPRAQQM